MNISEYGKIDLVLWDTYRPGRGPPTHSSTPSINRATRAPLPDGHRPAVTTGHPRTPPPQPGHPRHGHDHPKIAASSRQTPACAAQCDTPLRDNHGGTRHVLQRSNLHLDYLRVLRDYFAALLALSGFGGGGGISQRREIRLRRVSEG